MVNVNEFETQIKNVELLKEGLVSLVKVAKKKIGGFCQEHAHEWATQKRTVETSKSLNYFSVSEAVCSTTENSTAIDYISIIFNNPLFTFILLFLIFFIVIYIATFILYCNCGRGLISFFSCGLFLKKNNKTGEKESEKESTNVKENNGDDNDINNIMEQGEMGASRNNSIDNNEKEEQKNIKPKSEQKKKKELKMIIILVAGLILLITLFFLHINATAALNNSNKDVYHTACEIIDASENILIGECSNEDSENTNSNMCFTVRDTLNDGIDSLKAFVEVIKLMEEQNILSTEKTIPLFQELEENSMKLRALGYNIKKNGKMLVDNYKHYLFLGKNIETIVDTVLTNIDSKKNAVETVINEAKEKIIAVGEQMEKLLKEDVNHILKNVNEMMKKLKDRIIKSETTSSPKAYGDSFFKYIKNTFNILLIPMYLIFIVTCVFIFYLIKKNEQSYNKLIVKSAGFFSVYFGIITIFILIFALIFTFMSVLGSTTCMLTKTVSNNKECGMVSKFTKEIPIIGTCLKDEKASFVNEKYVKEIENKIFSFDFNPVTENINKFTKLQEEIMDAFQNSFNAVSDKLWLIQVDFSKKNTLFNGISDNNIKTALLTTHIYKKNIKDAGLRGVDNFLNVANHLFFQNNTHALCYEDPLCENHPNKYNITMNSTINDNKYTTVKNYVNENLKNDLDKVLQLLAYKAQIAHKNIFDISDLDSNRTDKLNIKNYISPNFVSGESDSFIHFYINDLIEKLKNPKSLGVIKNIIARFLEVKDHTINKVYTYKKKLNCQVVMAEVVKVKDALCNNLIVGIAHIAIIYFVISLLTFFLWLYFLCLWVNHKMKIVRNNNGKEELNEKSQSFVEEKNDTNESNE